MTRYRCDCGNVLFFENFQCVKCTQLVGYDPELQTMVTIKPGSPLVRCANNVAHGVCNWLVTANSGETLCLACRLNRTIPDLHNQRNVMLWGRFEAAKRRLIASLLSLKIPLRSKKQDASFGLAFDFVSVFADPKVTTGHFNGVVTLNIEEADDTYRQINRANLGESSRTILGHLRHEMGHYVWQRWIGWQAPGPLLEASRHCFGDERTDYAVALERYYQHGTVPGWDVNYISAYASAHPWEDWAETFAHYLQIHDGLETFENFGCRLNGSNLPPAPNLNGANFLPPTLQRDAAEDDAFALWLQRWLAVSSMLNEVSASLGQPLLYPFTISNVVAGKLRLVRHVLRSINMGGKVAQPDVF
ncbi:MAG: putative zinc-binding metallopeptidase [Verrucomicrobiaceae bacterium]